METQIKLTPWQIKNLSSPIVSMVDKIEKFYQNPDNERRFQEWYKRTYGVPVPKGV